MQRILIIAGTALIAVRLLWPWPVQIPIFRLPGDIFVNEAHLRVYVPITTRVGLSVVVSLLP